MDNVYGYDIGNNKVEVTTKESFNNLAMEVDFKQNNLSATNGILQDDCNEVDVTGYYYISTTTANGPGVDGILSVVRLNESGSIIVQEVLNTAGSIKYTRVKANSVWGDWRPNYYNMDTIIDMLNANIEQNAGNISQLQADVATKQNAVDDTLVTDDKTIPGAINELATEASILATEVSNKQPKNDPSLNTQSKLVAGAINELNAAIANAQALISSLETSVNAKAPKAAVQVRGTSVTDMNNRLVTEWNSMANEEWKSIRFDPAFDNQYFKGFSQLGFLYRRTTDAYFCYLPLVGMYDYYYSSTHHWYYSGSRSTVNP